MIYNIYSRIHLMLKNAHNGFNDGQLFWMDLNF